MARLLFRLNGAPEDEVREVRELLTEHRIEFYETDAGRWGVSVAGIWLPDDTQLERAQALLDAYQAERTHRIRAHFEAQRLAGRHDTLAARLWRHPLQTLLYAIAIGAILYLSIAPFVSWR